MAMLVSQRDPEAFSGGKTDHTEHLAGWAGLRRARNKPRPDRVKTCLPQASTNNVTIEIVDLPIKNGDLVGFHGIY